MVGLRYQDLANRPDKFRHLTSLPADEFTRLLEPFEAAFQAHMADWRLEGQPRTARSYTTYKNCPLPTPTDRLLFILIYLKTNPLQVAHGRMFALLQGKANQWIHVLLIVLQTTLRTMEDTPARSVANLARRLGLPKRPSLPHAHRHALLMHNRQMRRHPRRSPLLPNGASRAPHDALDLTDTE
jgi:hypothetical protein